MRHLLDTKTLSRDDALLLLAPAAGEVQLSFIRGADNRARQFRLGFVVFQQCNAHESCALFL